MEYQFPILPGTMQTIIAGQGIRSARVQRIEQDVEKDQRGIAALKSAMLSAWARAVMETRAEAPTSIEGHAAAHAQPRAWGLARVLAAQETYQHRQEIEQRRDAGEILTDRDRADLARILVLTAPDGLPVTADPRRPHRGRG